MNRPVIVRDLLSKVGVYHRESEIAQWGDQALREAYEWAYFAGLNSASGHEPKPSFLAESQSEPPSWWDEETRLSGAPPEMGDPPIRQVIRFEYSGVPDNDDIASELAWIFPHAGADLWSLRVEPAQDGEVAPGLTWMDEGRLLGLRFAEDKPVYLELTGGQWVEMPAAPQFADLPELAQRLANNYEAARKIADTLYHGNASKYSYALVFALRLLTTDLDVEGGEEEMKRFAGYGSAYKKDAVDAAEAFTAALEENLSTALESLSDDCCGDALREALLSLEGDRIGQLAERSALLAKQLESVHELWLEEHQHDIHGMEEEEANHE